MENLVAENTRLRKELKAKNNAYRTLQEEKDEAIKVGSLLIIDVCQLTEIIDDVFVMGSMICTFLSINLQFMQDRSTLNSIVCCTGTKTSK